MYCQLEAESDCLGSGKCSAPCVLTSCTSPLTSSLQPHASSLLRKYHCKRDTYVHRPVHFYHLANCIRQHQVLPTWPFFVAVLQSHRPFQQGQAPLGHRLSSGPSQQQEANIPYTNSQQPISCHLVPASITPLFKRLFPSW